MKKFLTMSVLALSLAAVSEQQASAWCKFNFGAGFNLSFESANNSGLWNAFRNGPPPGYADVMPPVSPLGCRNGQGAYPYPYAGGHAYPQPVAPVFQPAFPPAPT